MELVKDTPTAPETETQPPDPHKTGTGGPDAPGGKDAPAKSAYELSHGQEEYPGPSPGGESAKTGEGPHGTA